MLKLLGNNLFIHLFILSKNVADSVKPADLPGSFSLYFMMKAMAEAENNFYKSLLQIKMQL